MEENKNNSLFNSIAVLVDADNAAISKMELIVNKILTFGRITLRRAYGNWKKENLKDWEDVIKDLAFNPQQQFDYVKKKNATDIALVIDAMKLLYTGRYDAFVIVSSDSDYTPLSITLKETGVYVIGIGNKNASDAFKRSCDDFYSVQKLSGNTLNKENVGANEVKVAEKPKVKQLKGMSEKERELHEWLKMGAETERWQNDEGFVNVSSIGQYIQRIRPDFDITAFGYKKLPEFIEANPEFYETKDYQKGKVRIRTYKCK